jgi:O-antigen ligase
MLLLVLLKSAGIGYGYPNLESQLGNISYLPQQVMQILVLGLLLLYLFVLPKQLLHFRISSPILLSLTVVILTGLFTSPHFMLTFRYLLSFLVTLLPIILFQRVYGSDKLYEFLKFFFTSVLITSAVYTVIFPHFAIMGGNHSGAIRGVFMHKNMFGICCVITSLFYLTSFLKAKSLKYKSIFLVLYTLSFVLVIGSKSTTSLLLFFLLTASYIFFLSLSKIKSMQKRALIYYLFLSALIMLTVTFSAYYEEIAYALGKDPTLTGRTELWDVLLQIAFDRPVVGHGLGLFYRPEIMYQYSIEFGWDAKSAHSSYIDLFLGIGFLGTGLILFYIFSTLFRFPFRTDKDPIQVLAAASMVLPLCFGMTESGMMLSTKFTWVCLVSFLLISNNPK